MSSRLRKQSRQFCGHCNEYLSRTAFWKHRKAYYDVQSERWTSKDDAEHLEHEAKRARYDPDHLQEFQDMRPSESSGDEDLDAAISSQG